MPLLDTIKAAPKPLAVDYAYLHANAGPFLQPKLVKRKDSLETTVVMNVTDKAQLNTCTRLSQVVSLTSGILFNPPGKKQNLKLNKPEVVAFRSALLLFDPDNPAKKIMDEYTTNPSDGTFEYLSGKFMEKHFANDGKDAEEKAADRYTKDNEIKVSSFLYPSEITKFADEVEKCNPLFEKLLARIRSKEASYRQRNKRIDDLAIRSAHLYNKVQCTQNNSFVPAFYDPEYMYYSISTPTGSPKIICDHYVAKSNVFAGASLKPGWKDLDYTKFTDPSERPPFEIKIYVKSGTFD